MGQFFGTDGIRGRAGEGKLSDAGIARMARAIGAHFGPGTMAAIGRDTRESGSHIQSLIERELTTYGVSVRRLGILPTPATALIAQDIKADFAIMITASHNPYHDNGVKLFGSDGRKLSPSDQDAIEALITAEPASSGPVGEVHDHDSAADDYIAALLETVGDVDHSGLRIVADCANGAAYAILPRLLERLGAKPELIGVKPNGRNINAECGSTHTDKLAAAVMKAQADVGIALDGDADRIMLVDRQGHEIDGDQIMARMALNWAEKGTLRGGTVVSTVMSNLGLERFLQDQGLSLERTAVGDRFVAARMVELGANLGGEPSGHILMTDYGTTGDGCLAALQVIAGLVESGQASDDYLNVFSPYPQVLKNVVYRNASPLNDQEVQTAIRDADEKLGQDGRVLVRASGTEPKIRVMAEGMDEALVSDVVEELCALIAAKSV